MKYLIETYGCQMNVHDSERMAGLLEQAGYEPAADDTRRRRHRHQHLQRARAGRGEALHAARRDPAAGRSSAARVRSSRSPAASRSRKATSILARSSAVDVVIGTQNIKRLPMLVEQARRAAGAGARRIVDIDPLDDVSFPLGVARRADPLKAYVTIIEGCNEFCAFCVVPYTRGHERMRPVAAIVAEARQAVGDGRARDPAPRPDRQPLPGARRCGVRLRGAARAAQRDRRACERIRFASPHPRHVTPRMIEAMRDLPEGLPAPAPAGAVRLDARPRRDAPPPHARGLPRARRAASATPCRTSRSRPI